MYQNSSLRLRSSISELSRSILIYFEVLYSILKHQCKVIVKIGLELCLLTFIFINIHFTNWIFTNFRNAYESGSENWNGSVWEISCICFDHMSIEDVLRTIHWNICNNREMCSLKSKLKVSSYILYLIHLPSY